MEKKKKKKKIQSQEMKWNLLGNDENGRDVVIKEVTSFFGSFWDIITSPFYISTLQQGKRAK